ncbi:hypothetical protein SISSUDRAFT_1016973, partial [Sistotremastrum suecicum HHB10207 ss-3]
MATAYPVLAILVLVLIFGAVGWFATPKGGLQTLIRTSILLTLTCCYLMWAITYLAQLNPLICASLLLMSCM